MDVDCPQCASSNTKSIASCAQAGNWATVAQVNLNGMTGPMAGTSIGIGQTQLAAVLAQPGLPPPGSFTTEKAIAQLIGIPSGILMVIGMLVALFGDSRASSGGFVITLIGMLGTVIGLMFGSNWKEIERQNTAQEVERPVYDAAAAIWSKLWYCDRCHIAYEPSSGTIIPANELQAWLLMKARAYLDEVKPPPRKVQSVVMANPKKF